MKKIYTLIACLAITFGATAQFDLSATFVAYAEGSTVDDDPMNGQITIVNEGAPILAGDTLTFGLFIDDGPYGLDLTAGVYNFFVLEEPMATGDEMTFGTDMLAWAALGISVECCATVYGVGEAAVTDHAGDSNPDDNRSCITYNLPEVDDSGIEDFELTLSNVYVAAGQLMIVNDGFNSDEIANLNIVNMGGQVVQTENFTLTQGTNAVEIDNLSTGIYIVAIEVEGAVITRKISIQ